MRLYGSLVVNTLWEQPDSVFVMLCTGSMIRFHQSDVVPRSTSIPYYKRFDFSISYIFTSQVTTFPPLLVGLYTTSFNPFNFFRLNLSSLVQLLYRISGEICSKSLATIFTNMSTAGHSDKGGNLEDFFRIQSGTLPVVVCSS